MLHTHIDMHIWSQSFTEGFLVQSYKGEHDKLGKCEQVCGFEFSLYYDNEPLCMASDSALVLCEY